MTRTLLALSVFTLGLAAGCGSVATSGADAGDDTTDVDAEPPPPPACLIDADCTSDPGLTFCVAGACVACDDDTACSSGAPVCDPGTHSCGACVDSSDCALYPDVPVCGTDGACHKCTADAECASDACDFDTGACLDPGAVVYVAPGGSSGGTCGGATNPCDSLTTAAPRVTAARAVVRMTTGTYGGQIVSATAAPMIVHAAGATIRVDSTASPTGVFAGNGADVTLYDARFDVIVGAGASFMAINVNTGTRVELARGAITMTGSRANAIQSNGTLVVIDSTIQATGLAVATFAGTTQIERSRITGSDGVYLGAPVFIVDNNVFSYNRGTGVVIDSDVGWPKTFTFNSFIANGQSLGSGPTELDIQRAVGPDASHRFKASWNLFTNARPYTGSTGLRLVNGTPAQSLLDQPNLPPAADTNIYAPAGVDADGHLTAGSAAIDAVATAPGANNDIDGQARPHGAGYDVGADEYVP